MSWKHCPLWFFLSTLCVITEASAADLVETVKKSTGKGGFFEQLLDPNSSYRRWEMENFWLLFSAMLCLGLIFIVGTFFIIHSTPEAQPTRQEDKKSQ
eukprot:jgi/Galph1/2012/GphlegSOOS_G685.1